MSAFATRVLLALALVPAVSSAQETAFANPREDVASEFFRSPLDLLKGRNLFERVRELTLRLYAEGSAHAES